jgi:thiamine biosynthesis protein ThiI
MDEGTGHLAVLRYGELFLKGGNRSRFESILLRNVRRALAPLGEPLPEIERGQGRLFVRLSAELLPGAMGRLARVFGIASLSPAVEVAPEIEAIAERAAELVQQRIRRQRPATFRVTARRSDKRFGVNSQEIGRLVGARIVEETGLAVDLTRPELVVGVEVGPVRSFVFVERVPGAGGLPVGASGQVALLLSGGIDSPVAGHLMQKRGCVLHAIHFHSFPYTGERSRDKVVQLARALAPAQGRLELHVAPFTEAQLAIRNSCPAEMAVVLYRRMMMRIASILGEERGCVALATGENLGQVASQTLENMACIEHAATLPVLRPLLTFDKAETVELARRVGTYEISIQPYEDCCALFVPKHPLTRATAGPVAEAEQRIDVEALVQDSVARTEHEAIGP